MNLEDTWIEQAGVMRCCLATVAEEYEGKQVEIGDKSECRHCHTKFTLVAAEPGWKKPRWKPDWQLEKK